MVRSMYLPAALHGIEASLLALDSLRKLRSSISPLWPASWLPAVGKSRGSKSVGPEGLGCL